MLRLTRTAIGLLTAQYRSVLKKCWAINVGVFGLMGKAVASVSKGAADTIGGALNGYGINVMAYMLNLLDGLLNIKSNAFGEQSAKAPATELPFGAPTVAGTFSFFDAENGNVTDDLSIMQLFKNKLFTAKTLPTALVAATVMATTLTAMPTEAEALKWCIASSASTTPLRLVANNTICPDGYANFGTQSGEYSSAVGYDNTASGSYSSAFGYWNIASGTYSSAFGFQNKASGILSSAFGAYAQATGTNTLALGAGAVANVADTISVGWRAGENSRKISQEDYDIMKSDLDFILSRGAITQKEYNEQLAELNLRLSMNEDHFRRIVNVANGTDAHDAATVGQMNTALNNYYRKEDLGGGQVIDFTRYFKSENFAQNERFLGVANDNFATNLPSNLTSKIGGFVTNHPPRLGAFAKCEKACSRLSERYIAALGKNRAFERYSRSARGTFLRVQETNKNVLDSFSQTVANINVVNDNFAVETNTVAA